MTSIRTRLAQHPRVWRWALRLGIALLATWVVYVAGANALLASHLIDREINRGTKDVEMHIGSAWTLWPGYVHVNDYSLRVDDGNLQALLYVEHAVTWVDLLPLAKKRVNLRHPVATGARFWMRHRVSAIVDDNRAQVAAYAPIPDAGPPLFDKGRLAEPAPPPNMLWQVDIEDGDASGTEIWVQEFRYRGAFHGHGGFYLWPLTEFTLPPTAGALEPGTLTIGEHTVSEDFAIDLQLQMARFEVPKVLGLDPARGLDAHAVITATMPDGKFLEIYRALGIPPSTFKAATLRAEADFHEKHFTELTDVLLVFKDVTLRHEAVVTVEGPLQLAVKGKPKGHLEVAADTLGLSVKLGALPTKTPLRIERTSVRGDLRAEIDQPFEASLGALRGTFVVPSLDWVSRLTAGKVHAAGGLTTMVNAHRDEHGMLVGTLDSTLEDVQLTAATLAAAASGKLKSSFAADEAKHAATFTGLALDLPTLTLRAGGSSRTTWLKAKLPTAKLETEPAFAFRGQGDVEAGDSALFAVPIEDQGGVAAFASRWLRGGQANLRGGVFVGAGAYEFSIDRGRVGAVEIAGFVKRVGAGPFGAFAVSTAGLTAGIRLDAGGVSVTPFAGEEWVHAQRAKAH